MLNPSTLAIIPSFTWLSASFISVLNIKYLSKIYHLINTDTKYDSLASIIDSNLQIKKRQYPPAVFSHL